MPVRKTESRIPANFQPADLGEVVVAADGRCTLISFVTSPIVVNRENVYVLFVTDASLAGTAQSYEWKFEENGDTTKIQTSEHGEITYQPLTLGALSLTVRILDASNAEQSSLALTQEVVMSSVELEALIAEAADKPGPGAANPDVLRELVNEHSRYYQSVKLVTPEVGDGFTRFTFGTLLGGALQRTALQRKQHVEQLASALNDQEEDFVGLAAQGVGVSCIRLPLLAMTLPKSPSSPATLLNWTELPESANQRAFADEQLRHTLVALDEDTKIDLFNLVRFPKSNITQCSRILETLRNRYFSGTNFDVVLKGMSGVRALLLNRDYREGPLLRN